MERRALLSTATAPPADPAPSPADDIKTAVAYIKDNFKGTGLEGKIGTALDQLLKDGKIGYGNTGPDGGTRNPDTGVITISDTLKGDVFGTAYALVHEGVHAALDGAAPGNTNSVYEEFLAQVYKVEFFRDQIKPSGLKSDLSKYLKADNTIDSDKLYGDVKANYTKLPDTDPKVPVGDFLPAGVATPAQLQPKSAK